MALSEDAAGFGIAEVSAFRWLVISGRPGADDFGVLTNGQAVVSEAALQMLQAHSLDNCDIGPYSE